MEAQFLLVVCMHCTRTAEGAVHTCIAASSRVLSLIMAEQGQNVWAC